MNIAIQYFICNYVWSSKSITVAKKVDCYCVTNLQIKQLTWIWVWVVIETFWQLVILVKNVK